MRQSSMTTTDAQNSCNNRILTLVRPRLPDAPIIFDVGASTGCWTYTASRIFPNGTFYLFEPMYSISDVYAERFNAMHKGNPDIRLTLHPVAIGESIGQCSFHLMEEAVGSTTLDLPSAASTYAQRRQVPMITLDHVVDSQLAPQPDFIKMDIQGGELAALRGSTKILSGVTALHLETWLEREYWGKTPLLAEVIAYLSSFGFRVFDFGDEFRRSGGELYAIDVTFVRDH